MAEFCHDCWDRIHGKHTDEKMYVMSKSRDLCEECGQWKSVIVRLRMRYVIKNILQDLRQKCPIKK